MRKILQCRIYLAQQSAETFQQVLAVRTNLRERRTRNKGEHPRQALRPIRNRDFSLEFTDSEQEYARKGNSACVLFQMLQSPALQIDKRALAGRMHNLEHKLAPTVIAQMKVIVVFAGQRFCYRGEAVNFTRKTRGLFHGNRVSHAGFKKHATNLNDNSEGRPLPFAAGIQIEESAR